MMIEKYKINILGSEWKIYFSNSAEDRFLRGADGYMDRSTRSIVIGEIEPDCEVADFSVIQKNSMRHEIIHAFFEESGLSINVENKNLGVSETYVDWFAIQSPKIYKIFRQLNLL